MTEVQKLKIVSATANNLKNLSVELPLKSFLAITGPSGSGKTTLLRDIIYSEWRRRATQDPAILPQEILGLPPVFFFGNQRPPRSKENVLDGLKGSDYLFELALRLGEQRCVCCNEKTQFESLENLYLRLRVLINQTLVVGIPVRKEDFENTPRQTDIRIFDGNKVVRAEEVEDFPFIKALDSIQILETSQSRLLELLKHAEEISPAVIELLVGEKRETVYLIPTCLGCGNNQRILNRSLLEKEGLEAQELLKTVLGRNSIEMFLAFSLEESVKELLLFGELKGVEEEILESFKRLLNYCLELGLGYLSLDRKLKTLSSGEFQRVKLAASLAEQLYGSLIALDEPSSGLSPIDTKKLSHLLSSISKAGNTVFTATHSREIIEDSDEVLLLQRQPNPISYQGLGEKFVSQKKQTKISDLTLNLVTNFLHLSHVNLNNLFDLECKIPSPGLTTVYGISGSGKSTLALQVILPLISKLIRERKNEAELPFGKIAAPQINFGRIVFFRTARFFSFRRAGVISALGAVPALRELYQKTELALVKGLKARDFNFYNPTATTFEIRFKGISFNDLGSLSVEEALKHFSRIPALRHKFQSAVDLGVGYLKLNQPLKELSAGDEQRLSLASRIAQLSLNKTFFILDEPLSGLSEEEQLSVLKVLRKLVDDGHTIVAVDHSPLILPFSDQSIELGPGAGKNGGKVVSLKITA